MIPKRRSAVSGQSVLAVVLFASVILMMFMVGWFSIRRGSNFQTGSSQRTKGRNVAVEGIVYAANQLSKTAAIWDQALNHDNYAGTDCNGGTIKTPSGTRFKLACSNQYSLHPTLQKYEVAVTATFFDARNKPVRAVKSHISQRTLGLDLATGQHAGAAVQLVNQPTLYPQGDLIVHWGPVACLDSNTEKEPGGQPWRINGILDSGRYPRKFSQGGIWGTYPERSGSSWDAAKVSDGREYWAYVAHNFPPLVNDDEYEIRAKDMSNITKPKMASQPGTDLPPTDCTGGGPPSSCAYYSPDTEYVSETVVFDNGYGSTLPPGAVVFVRGAAEFRNVAFKDDVTVVVTGNLTISADGPGTSLMQLHVPNTAPAEYPYYYLGSPQTPSSWPCMGKEGAVNTATGDPRYNCDASDAFPNAPNAGAVHFKGFLYVKGNLIIEPGVHWHMVGSLLVGDMQVMPGNGGRLQIEPGASLSVAYDDHITHKIVMNAVSDNTIKLVHENIRDTVVP